MCFFVLHRTGSRTAKNGYTDRDVFISDNGTIGVADYRLVIGACQSILGIGARTDSSQ